MTILELDAGNTFIKWRALQQGEVIQKGRFLTVGLAAEVLPDVWSSADYVRIASVAGEQVNQQLACAFVETQQVYFAKTASAQAGLINSYQDPSRMGVDRWLVMLAAYHDAQGPCCIVDCGSAITVDYVSASGQHVGGYILPGLRLMNQSLRVNTAEVIVDQTIEQFNTQLGRSTSEAVIHGVNYMFTALARQISEDIATSDAYRLYVTGGDGQLFQKYVPDSRYVEDLVMDGLKYGVEIP